MFGQFDHYAFIVFLTLCKLAGSAFTFCHLSQNDDQLTTGGRAVVLFICVVICLGIWVNF